MAGGSRVGRLFVEIAGDTNPLRKSLDQAVESARQAGLKVHDAGRRMIVAFESTLNPTIKLTEQVRLLEAANKSGADIWKVYGQRMKDAAAVTKQNGQQVDPLIQKYINLNDTVEKTSVNITERLKTMGREYTAAGRAMTIGVTMPIVGAGFAAIKLAGEFEQTKIAFTTMLGSGEKSARFLKELRAFAENTPFEFKDLVDASKRMMALGFNAEQVLPTLKTIGDAVAGLGGGSQMIDRVTLALGQMQAKGKVSAQEMNQLAEAGIPAWESLSRSIGVSIPEAMKLAEKGAISSSVAIPAILASMNEKFGGLMEKQNKTVLGQLSNLKDQIYFMTTDFGTALMPMAKAVMDNFLKPMAEQLKSLVKWFTELPKFSQGLIVSIAGIVAAIGPALVVFGTMATGIAAIIPLMVKLGVVLKASTVLMGPWGLAIAAATVAIITYSDEIATWIERATRFVGLAERMPKVAKASADKYRDVAEALHVSDTTLETFTATNKRALVIFGQHRDEIAKLWSEVQKGTRSQIEYEMALSDMLNTGKKAPGVLDPIKKFFAEISDKTNEAKERLDAFNASYWDSFKWSENIPRAPWDARIIQLEDYFGKLREITIAEDAALKAREAVASPLDDPILTNLDQVFDLNAHIKEAAKEFDNLRKTTDRNSEAMSQFGQVVSTTLTNATQTIAEKVTAWMGPFRHFAKAALAALMEGLFNPLFKILTAVGNAIGTWLTGAMGGMLGGAGNTMSFGSMIKAGLGIGGGVGLGAIGGGGTAAMTGATLGPGLAGAGPVAIGGAATTGGAAAGGGFLGSLAAVGPYAALAIPAVFGGMALADWANGPNSYEAGAKEVKRDYGLQFKPKDIAAFFSGIGVSEPEAWDQRWGLLRSPQFQQFAIARGQTSDFSKFGPEWEAAYEKAMIGKWGDYNELFLDEFANKNPDVIDMKDWYDRLTIPNQSGQSAQQQQQSISVRGGDMNLTVNISGSGNELVNIVRTKVIPILQQEMRRGSTGLRESIAASVRATAGAY